MFDSLDRITMRFNGTFIEFRIVRILFMNEGGIRIRIFILLSQARLLFSKVKARLRKAIFAYVSLNLRRFVLFLNL